MARAARFAAESLENRRLLSIAGDLDPTFGGGDGIATAPAPFDVNYATTFLPSGFLSAGSQRVAAGLRMAVARYRADGALDTSFGANGIASVASNNSNVSLVVRAVAAAPDGKYLVAGNAWWTNPDVPATYSLAVARFNNNGELDTTFGSGGLAKLSGIGVTSMVVAPEGKVLIGDGFGVARLTAAGKFDTTFGGGDGVVWTEFFDGSGASGDTQLKLLPDGRTMVVGTANIGNKLGDTDVALVRYTAAGALDKTFGNGTGKVTTNFFAGEPGFSFDYGNTIAVRPDGGFYVGGTGDDGPWFASYNASGMLARAAAVPMGGTPRMLTIGKGGKVLAIGDGDNNVLARINPDLTLDKAFGPGGEDGDGVVTLPFRGSNLTAVPDGRFYVIGSSNAAFAVARYLADPVAPPADGNDQIAEAAAIAVGGGVTQDVNPATDADMYKFSVRAGQRVGFDIDRSAGSTLDSYIRLFNASGAQLLANNNGFAPGEPTSTTESYVEYTFPAAGTYYVGVSGLGNVAYDPISGAGDKPGSIGGYRLTLTDRTGSDPDDQIVEAVPLAVGATVVGKAISPSGDVDVYKFTVAAGQRVGFDVDRPAGSGLDSYLRVFDASGRQLAANDNGAAPGEGPNVGSYLAYTFANAGTYYVAVSGSPNRTYNPLTGSGDVTGGPTSTGAYSLQLTKIGSPIPAAIRAAGPFVATPIAG